MSQASARYIKTEYRQEEDYRQEKFRVGSALDGNSYFLSDRENNLFKSIRRDAIEYFSDNNIAWWKYGKNSSEYPTDHMVSSQIQCLNFLYALRNDEAAVLQLAQLFDGDIDAVLQVQGDKQPGYLSFEFVQENKALLNEDNDGVQRGAFCTSVDVFLIAKRKGQKLLVPIEWKYTESYLEPTNKALEKGKGRTRQKRYNQLISDSKQLKTPPDFEQSLFYYEPYYELMRQTLLVEKIVEKELADDFLHILVAPTANDDFLKNSYACELQGLGETWKSQLENPEKFMRIDSNQILDLLGQMPDYSALYNYLKLRYC
ncbi:PGN_0703 family putative restriction endonuclease [Sunxiuqinia sp. sy24]|uniref:PGN_0703 family putative restriction endonuclease n=1 Tax=Sunxiuqinia sp. sy24 TaxID=3461495 RepID=UPI0040451B83